jgi:threonine/homoserine/homoserine lactone efflux protein
MNGELATVASFTLCAALLTITPGADTVLVLTQGVRSGRRAALACALGVNTGLICWAIFTVAGLTALLATVPWVYRCLQIAGAAYLICLGVAAMRRRQAAGTTAFPCAAAPTAAPATATNAFCRGLVTNLLNPKVGIFYVSLLPQFAPSTQRGPVLLLALAAIHLVLSVTWLVAIGWASAQTAHSLSGRTTWRLQRIGALALIGAGVAVTGASL